MTNKIDEILKEFYNKFDGELIEDGINRAYIQTKNEKIGYNQTIFSIEEFIKSKLTSLIEEHEKEMKAPMGVSEWIEHGKKYGYYEYLLDKNVGQLRQWLNEERITEPGKMVTDEKLKTFLTK